MNLFQSGSFVLSSGAKASWKLECDALTDDDWKTLAVMVREMVGPFSDVYGVPKGGLILDEMLDDYRDEKVRRALIVDDVLTTGGSMERFRNRVSAWTHAEIVGAVVFARGPCPAWIKPLFQMPESLWVKQ